jgi:hypothetical protein
VLRLDGALDGDRAPMGKSKAVSSHRSPRKKDPESDAKTRKGWDRVLQLPMTFCGHQGDLECSGLTELWMGIERVDGKIQSGVKPPQSKKPGSGISREAAKARNKRKKQLSREFPGPRCAVAQGVLWP